MRLPEAQQAALDTANFSSALEIRVEKWTNPTHLYGYRIRAVTLHRRSDAEVVHTFEETTLQGLLVCAAYERLVMAFYDDSENKVDCERALMTAIDDGLASVEDTNDRAIVLTGNVVDGLTMTGPFEDAHAAVEWVNENDVDEYVVAPLKHPEA